MKSSLIISGITITQRSPFTNSKKHKKVKSTMKLVVDMFRDSGKWYATAELPVTDELLDKLNRKYGGYSLKGTIEYIQENQQEVTTCDEFWWSVRLEDQPEESHEFCRFLRKPFES